MKKAIVLIILASFGCNSHRHPGNYINCFVEDDNVVVLDITIPHGMTGFLSEAEYGEDFGPLVSLSSSDLFEVGPKPNGVYRYKLELFGGENLSLLYATSECGTLVNQSDPRESPPIPIDPELVCVLNEDIGTVSINITLNEFPDLLTLSTNTELFEDLVVDSDLFINDLNLPAGEYRFVLLDLEENVVAECFVEVPLEIDPPVLVECYRARSAIRNPKYGLELEELFDFKDVFFNIYSDGTARLFGTVKSHSDNSWWLLDVVLSPVEENCYTFIAKLINFRTKEVVQFNHGEELFCYKEDDISVSHDVFEITLKRKNCKIVCPVKKGNVCKLVRWNRLRHFFLNMWQRGLCR